MAAEFQDLSISTEDELIKHLLVGAARQTFLLVRPWSRYDFELPDFTDDTNICRSSSPHWMIHPVGLLESICQLIQNLGGCKDAIHCSCFYSGAFDVFSIHTLIILACILHKMLLAERKFER
ncbi:hypothetical protein CY34DRAFT_800379 [Suillus luteus UH-Slu-Lm8-n1]|uniref:Uncharacterized protein n=1 Tax=Suillus luteus UH-Slu-Lm8-n1 TaxID=930992 RepID=A0A0D0BA08_9AGAM|nr:hypothetical protein CY34DRAFT_800379 [Suillus luteus UH-Slu-Lm8-n1]